jgi:hypothetical protein
MTEEQIIDEEIAIEIAIMKLANLVHGLYLALGREAVWHQAVEPSAIEEFRKPDLPANVVKLFPSGSDPERYARVSAMASGLLEGRPLRSFRET